MRHRDPHLLLETLLTLARVITLALKRSYARYIPVAVYVRYRPVDVGAVAPAANGGVLILASTVYRGLAHAGTTPATRHAENRRDG